MITGEEFLAFLLNGLVTGSAYALIAIGLTLIFGILNVVNFAHGELYAIGGYGGVIAMTSFGLPFYAALPIVMLLAAVMGIVLEFIAFRPLRRRAANDSMVSSFGIAIALQNVFLITFGPHPKMIRTDLSQIRLDIFGVFITAQRAAIVIATLILVVAFHLVLVRTWLGRSLRAVSQNASTAAVLGVNVSRVASITFAIGGALAASAGLLMSTIYVLHPAVGSMIALKAFTVVILGGMGNVYGAVAAGLLLGVTESLTAGLLFNEARDIVGFGLVIAILLFQPNGLFNFGRSYERA
jgi:branched-chain amino acid transport system permease protein